MATEEAMPNAGAPAGPTRRTRRGRRVAADVVVCLVTILLIELALRHVIGGMEHVLLYERQAGGTESCGGLQPGASVMYTGWFLKVPAIRQEVNRYGFRGPERPRERAPETFRIAAVGDSFTYGLDATVDEAIPARLERELAGTDPRVEVLNFGVPGSALADTVVRVREMVGKWHPDLVLFELYADDLEQPLCRLKDPGGTVMRIASGHFDEVLAHPGDVASLAFGILTWKSYILRIGALTSRIGQRWLFGGRSDWSAEMTAQIHALAGAAAAIPAPLAIVALGDPSVYRRTDVLGGVLAQEHVPWLDARGWLFGRADERLPRIPGEYHFTAASNGVAAARIAAWLRSTGLVPAPAR